VVVAAVVAAQVVDTEGVGGQVHDLIQFRKGHLRLDHPELGQVPAGLGLFGPERGAETVDLAKGHGRGLHVELTTLG